MSKLGNIAGGGVALAALWLAALAITSVALEGRTRRGVADRIAESLDAEATIARGDLALVRGRIDLEDLAVRRDGLVGHLAIEVAALSCELPPLGLALVDRECRELAVRGPRLEVSTAALLQLGRRRRPPLHVQRVVIDDARLELSPSALVPSFGRVAIGVAHAEAGETTFKTPLSWLFALRSLEATVELSAGVTLRLSYAHGELRVAGGMFGATPVSLPVTLPVAGLADDPGAELAKLVELGKDVAKRLVERARTD